jgi:hypothetical protein
MTIVRCAQGADAILTPCLDASLGVATTAIEARCAPFPLDSPLIGFHTNAVADYVL